MFEWFTQAQETIDIHNALQTYEKAEVTMDELQSMFVDGQLNIEQKAQAESNFYQLCQAIHQKLDPKIKAQRPLWDLLNEKLATRYICNFSLFQSLPDIWAIDQVFPIMPISGLSEAPSHRGILGDITCDSDGRIDYYVDGAGVETTLPLPNLAHQNIFCDFHGGCLSRDIG